MQQQNRELGWWIPKKFQVSHYSIHFQVKVLGLVSNFQFGTKNKKYLRIQSLVNLKINYIVISDFKKTHWKIPT